MSENSILIVDDDGDLRRLIADFLAGNGFVVAQAEDAGAMRRMLAAREFDLIVLDLMMPGEDGLSVLRSMAPGTRPPVVMLSAMGTDVDRIVGLELGADDYLPKPCNPRELLARVRAVLRRAETLGAPRVCEFGDWRMDLAARELFAPDGRQVEVTPKEWRLLCALTDARRRVLSRDELIARLGGDDFDGYDRSVDIAVSRLRRKLAGYDGREVIRTVRGEGYGMALEVRQAAG